LGPDEYDRGKKGVLDKAKHPGFIGREFMFRCATKGAVIVAVIDGRDVGIVCVDHKGVLQTLSVIPSARKLGVGSALVQHVRAIAKFAKPIGDATAFFERNGYRPVGAAAVGQHGKHITQLMQRVEDWAPVVEAPIVEAPIVERNAGIPLLPFAGIPLLPFIHTLSPEYGEPFHLTDWCELIEQSARTEGVRGLCDVPIRHYKTETTLHGIVWLLVQDPTLEIIFLTHTLEAAQARGKRLRQLAEAAGVGPDRGTNTITHWLNNRGGGVVVMSAQQSKIGYNCHALIVDDPIDEDAADDPAIREVVDKTIAHYTARCMRRGKPGAVLILMSRWHPDDPIGRRLQRGGWRYIHHPVVQGIGADRRAFAPNVWDLPALDAMRAELKEADPTERIWYAQLMGDPQPEGADLFGPPTLYTQLPTYGYRVCHGIDFAYTNAPGADFFACVSGRIYGRKLYIIDVQRHRLDATLLESTCKTILATHGRAPMWSYQAGPELGLSRVLMERGVPMGIMPARYNKLVRAQKTIRRWNTGEILVPVADGHPWQPGFLHRISLFRGHEKDRDDEIDAVVACADAVLGGATTSAVRLTDGRRPYQGMLG